jgi:hypothetical protein
MTAHSRGCSRLISELPPPYGKCLSIYLFLSLARSLAPALAPHLPPLGLSRARSLLKIFFFFFLFPFLAGRWLKISLDRTLQQQLCEAIVSL